MVCSESIEKLETDRCRTLHGRSLPDSHCEHRPWQILSGTGDPADEPRTFPAVMIALLGMTRLLEFRRRNNSASAATATFEINYLSAGTSDVWGATCLAWDPAAQAAFSYAASVWATMIASTVPIRIDACWANLGSSTNLGHSGSYSARDFTGAPQSGTWYFYSLADALAGDDLDPANPDTFITYNNEFTWYFGTDGLTPSGGSAIWSPS